MSKRFMSVAALLVSSMCALACGHESAAMQEVRSAATVDLDCDASSLEIVDNSPMEKRVAGCGQELTYMYKCNPAAGGGQDCRWKAVPVKGDD